MDEVTPTADTFSFGMVFGKSTLYLRYCRYGAFSCDDLDNFWVRFGTSWSDLPMNHCSMEWWAVSGTFCRTQLACQKLNALLFRSETVLWLWKWTNGAFNSKVARSSKTFTSFQHPQPWRTLAYQEVRPRISPLAKLGCLESTAENILVYIVTISLASGPIQSVTSWYAKVLHASTIVFFRMNILWCKKFT